MTSFRRLIVFVFVLTILSCKKGNAQKRDFTAQENKFAILYSHLLERLQDHWDTIKLYSDKFTIPFTNFVKANSATLNYPFRKLTDSNYVQIKTSSDGHFRIYSWDTWTGGTMYEFNTIYQWMENGKVFIKIVPHTIKDDPGSFVSQIFTVTINNKPYYLPVTNGIYSNKDARQTIAVYTIDNSKLIDTVKLFKTKIKRLNRIDVDFDFFSVVDRPERPLKLITYDDKQKIIYIPVVGNKEQVTSSNIMYQLKGRYFEFIGVEKGKLK